MPAPRATRQSAANNPHIPIPIQRALRRIEDTANQAQHSANLAHAGLATKVDNTPEGIKNLSGSVGKALSSGGSSPLDLTGLNGLVSQPQTASIPTVSVLPTAAGKPGQALIFSGHLYTWTSAGWTPI